MVNFIICEFNPFHNGHAHLLKEVRPHPTVCIMSSHVTQRGDIAVTDKWTRAHMALECGADLVLELSAPFAMGNAHTFAAGAAALARATGLQGRFCYGTEGEVLPTLQRLAAIDDNRLDPTVKALQKQGYSYAKALATAYEQIDPQAATVLSTPNNVLALEYLRAAPDFAHFSISRIGAAHDSPDGQDGFCSASLLRENMSQYAAFTPSAIHVLYQKILDEGCFPDVKKKDLLWLHALRGLTVEQWDEIAPDGIGRRFARVVQTAESVEQLLSEVKTKCCTHASLRRLAMKAFLGLPPTDSPQYIRVLGANAVGRKILSSMRPTLPVLTKPAAVRELSAEACALMEYESRLTDHFMFMFPAPRGKGAEFLTSPVMVD